MLLVLREHKQRVLESIGKLTTAHSFNDLVTRAPCKEESTKLAIKELGSAKTYNKLKVAGQIFN
jgi:hypothetical protein